MKLKILFICSTLVFLSSCEFCVERSIKKCGFEYDNKYDMYVSIEDPCLQRRTGYDKLYDLSAIPMGMVIDCEPVLFEYNGKQFMIELWKGQYDLSTGAEIGIYERSERDLIKWDCIKNEYMLQMSYTLKNKGNEVFTREGTHWWLTGFKPGVYSEPENLTMDITISFDNLPGMLQPFTSGLENLGYKKSDYRINNKTITFEFKKPKTKQPWADNTALKKSTQKKNKILVDTYEKFKDELKITDNSPASINKLLVKMPELISTYFKQYKENKKRISEN